MNIEDQIRQYQENIGIQVITNNQDIFTVKEVIKHPLLKKPAYRFENVTTIKLCTDCQLYTKEDQNYQFKSYIGKTVYFTDPEFHNAIFKESKNNITYINKVLDAFINPEDNKQYVKLDDDTIKLLNEVKLFKDPNSYYTDFRFFDKITKEQWLTLYTTFQYGDEDILCFNTNNDDYKVKGFTLTQYSDQKWYLLPILFNTATNSFSFSIEKIELFHAMQRESKGILERNFYFLLNNRVVELTEKHKKNSLQEASIEIKWVFKKENLFDKLQNYTTTLETPKNERKSKKKI